MIGRSQQQTDLCASERKEILAKVVVGVKIKILKTQMPYSYTLTLQPGEIYLDLQLHYNEETCSDSYRYDWQKSI